MEDTSFGANLQLLINIHLFIAGTTPRYIGDIWISNSVYIRINKTKPYLCISIYFKGLNENEVAENRVEVDGFLELGDSLRNTTTTDRLMENITQISIKTGKAL